MTTEKENLRNMLGDMCVKCLVRFGYWMIKTTEDSAFIVNRDAPGLFDFSKDEANMIRNKMIDNALSGDIQFKISLTSLLWSIPDMWPSQFVPMAYATMLRECYKASVYCKGDNNVAHKEEIAIRFNLATKSSKTIGRSEAKATREQEKKIIVVNKFGKDKE